MENQTEQLYLTNYAKEYLTESAKWSKLLAIVGFVGIGLMMIAAIFMGTVFANLPMNELSGQQDFPFWILSFVYVIMAAIYFFPVYYLYQYATNTKNAILTNDSEVLEKGLEKLKSHHKFLGVMMLVVLSLYGVILLIALIGGGIAAAAM